MFNYGTRLVRVYDGTETFMLVRMPTGRRYRFLQNPDGTYTALINKYDTLVRETDGTYTYLEADSRATFRFDSEGKLTAILDANGNATAIAYGIGDQIAQVSDGQGNSLTFAYGPNGRVQSISDHALRTVQYHYDTWGNLSTFTNALGQQTHYFYESPHPAQEHYLTRIEDHWGRTVTEIGYNRRYRCISYTELGAAYTMTYEGDRTDTADPPPRTLKTTPYGTWIYDYDAMGMITQMTSPSGAATSYTYDAAHRFRLQSITDPVGVKTNYGYDSQGRLMTVTYDAGPGRMNLVYSYTYPGNLNRPARITAPAGWQSSEFEYDGSGNLQSSYRVQTDGLTRDWLVSYTYTPDGRIETVTRGGGTTSYSYGPQSTHITYPPNNDQGISPVYIYGYDSLGRQTTDRGPPAGRGYRAGHRAGRRAGRVLV